MLVRNTSSVATSVSNLSLRFSLCPRFVCLTMEMPLALLSSGTISSKCTTNSSRTGVLRDARAKAFSLYDMLLFTTADSVHQYFARRASQGHQRLRVRRALFQNTTSASFRRNNRQKLPPCTPQPPTGSSLKQKATRLRKIRSNSRRGRWARMHWRSLAGDGKL